MSNIPTTTQPTPLEQLGDLIIAGADKTLPLISKYICQEEDGIHACAIGCALLSDNPEALQKSEHGSFALQVCTLFKKIELPYRTKILVPNGCSMLIEDAVIYLNDELNWDRKRIGEWIKTAEIMSWL
jgi:hypothetical protein